MASSFICSIKFTHMKLKFYATAFVILLALTVRAQENEQPIDTLTRHTASLRQELDVMKRIKLSGYIQAQYRLQIPEELNRSPAEILLRVLTSVSCFAGQGLKHNTILLKTT